MSWVRKNDEPGDIKEACAFEVCLHRELLTIWALRKLSSIAALCWIDCFDCELIN